jgi:hypothetical protein
MGIFLILKYATYFAKNVMQNLISYSIYVSSRRSVYNVMWGLIQSINFSFTLINSYLFLTVCLEKLLLKIKNAKSIILILSTLLILFVVQRTIFIHNLLRNSHFKFILNLFFKIKLDYLLNFYILLQIKC